MIDTIVITHGFCQDGLAAAWVAREYLKKSNIRYVFGSKRDLTKDLALTGWKDSTGKEYLPLTIDDLKDKDVYILDYIYPLDTIKSIPYKTLTIIDHHETAESICKDCESLPNTTVHFDKTYSAAGLAWKVLLGNTGDMPWWIQYTQDRDLFKFSLPNSREITDAIYNLKYRTLTKFDELNSFTPEQKDKFIEQGIIIGSIKNELVTQICNNGRLCLFDNYRVYVVETGVLVSEVGERLYNLHKDSCDFVMCVSYDFDEKKFRCRLRCSQTSPLNLAKISEKYGGGGHMAAAGFSIHDIFSLLTVIPKDK